MIINAENLILGRMASCAAKKALLGEKVEIVNAEKAVIVGTKDAILAKYKRKMEMGNPFKGPFFPREPSRFVKRTIRGMLPYKQEKGRKALKNVRCYNGVPSSFEGQKIETIEKINVVRLNKTKFLKVRDISGLLGHKI